MKEITNNNIKYKTGLKNIDIILGKGFEKGKLSTISGYTKRSKNMEYYELFEKLEGIKGRKDKEELIKENWSEELKQIFIRVFDYNRQSYTNKIMKLSDFGTVNDFTHEQQTVCFSRDIVKLFDYMSVSGSACNINKHMVAWYLDHINEVQAKWDKRILQKDLKIGISENSLNKIYDDFIPTFEVMLCKAVENVDDLVFPIIAQPKLDGMRCVMVDGVLISRNGRTIPNTNLLKHLSDLLKETNYVFDGELYSHELTFNEIMSQVMNEDVELHPSIKYTIYDTMTKSEWKAQKCETEYNSRWQRIYSFTHTKSNCVWIGGKIINSTVELNDYYQECLSEGYEGIMVKGLKGLYEWKRVKQKIMGKIKPSETHDLKIINFEEGRGRNEKSLGALICDFGGISVKVGGGYDDEQRKEFWADRANLLGRWIEAKCQEVTPDGSLRFPIFVRFRDSKD